MDANDQFDSQTPARLLHGDAQGCNFLVSQEGAQASVKMIDPLGGSGAGMGDYLYDLSRLFHWQDSVTYCYAKKLPPEREQQALSEVILDHLRKTAFNLRDRHAALWFYVYASFHVSGKFADFKSPVHTRYLLSRLHLYLTMVRELATLDSIKSIKTPAKAVEAAHAIC